MIQKAVNADFKVRVPTPINPVLSQDGETFINANPQCGPFPFGQISMQFDPNENVAVFSAKLTRDFIRCQIIPRGRPHFSLLHVSLIDDAIASSSFQLVFSENYGECFRYLERDATICFHKEAFFHGSLAAVPHGAIFVNSYQINWICLPIKDSLSITNRGIVQVAIIGITNNDEIPIASVEIEYFRRKGVLNLN